MGTTPPETQPTPSRAWIGLDVSKQTLDACLLRETGKPLAKRFDNAPSGFAKLTRWVQSQAADTVCHYCLEATGSYGNAVAFFLAEAGQRVSVVNPFRIKHAALSRGVGNKTDFTDAQVLANYCRKEGPPLWRAAEPEVRLLMAFLRRLQNLKDQLLQENNRLGDPGVLKPVQHSLVKSIRFLKREIEAVEKSISSHVQAHARLREDRDLLTSIPGISDTTAHWILAELPDVSQFGSAQAAAAFAGLAPQEHRSGSSVRKTTRVSKLGNKHLRRALYMPALTALRHNPPIRALFERMVAKGKARQAAVGASMRKLLMIAYGVLKSRRTFDPTMGQPLTAST